MCSSDLEKAEEADVRDDGERVGPHGGPTFAALSSDLEEPHEGDGRERKVHLCFLAFVARLDVVQQPPVALRLRGGW